MTVVPTATAFAPPLGQAPGQTPGQTPGQAPGQPVPGITWRMSPHCSTRGRVPIRFIVLHADVAPVESATIRWLQDPRSRVSYHALVHRDGMVTRFVRDQDAAWACGESQWQGIHYLNRHSLSLAFANRHDFKERLTEAQRTTARRLIDAWRAAHPIEAVLTHAMISPGRKADPAQIPNFLLQDYA